MAKFVKQIGRFRISLRKYRLVKSQVPKILANMAKNHFLEGFRPPGGGQTDASKGGWNRKKDDTNSYLVDEGSLKDSVDVIGSPTFKSIVIGTEGVPYARRHNEGLKGMPKREFIGDSKELFNEMKKELTKEIKKSLI